MKLSVLSEKVAQVTGVDPEETRDVCTALMQLIARRLRAGETVQIRGLGTFFWQTYKARRRKHPKTGEMIECPERKMLRFRPAKKLLAKRRAT